MKYPNISAKIKDVYIELKDYKFLHSPFHASEFVKNRFVGRGKVKKRLKVLLTRSEGSSGTYLITGFRGMGKTSLLREAINEVNQSEEDLLDTIKTSFINTLRISKQFLWVLLSIILFHYFYIRHGSDLPWPDLMKWTNEIPSDNFNFLSPGQTQYLNWYNLAFAPMIMYLAGMALMPVWGLLIQAISWIYVKANKKGSSKKQLKKFQHIFQKHKKQNQAVFESQIYFYLFTSIQAFLLIFLFVFDFDKNIILLISTSSFFLIHFILFALYPNPNRVNKKRHKRQVYASVSIAVLALTLWVSATSNFLFLAMAAFFSTWIISFNSNGKTQLGDSFYQVLWTLIRLISSLLLFIGFLLSYNHLAPNLDVLGQDNILEDLRCHDGIGPWLFWGIGLLFSYLMISTLYFIHDLIGSTIGIITKKSLSLVKNKYEVFEINLSQDGISERDVLKRINDKILDFWLVHRATIESLNFDRPIYKPWQFIIRLFTSGMAENPSEYKRILERLNALQKRLGGSVSVTKEFGTNPNLSATLTGMPTEIALPIGKITDNRTINYPIASAKEAEDELIDIMKSISQYREQNKILSQFIFIIDELDKIEPQSSALIDEKEFSNPAMDIANLNAPGSREYRKRQEAVAKLLANLKGFLNVAMSKFFFIGGRELFDADLADIADRDSFYSSIFNDVIYVESFYKDLPDRDSSRGVTKLTETYLMKLIMSTATQIDPEDTYSLATLINKIDPSKEHAFSIGLGLRSSSQNQEFIKKSKNSDLAERFKIVSLLQNYIVYLTYRSTGTPKKLNSLIEHLIEERSFSKLKNDPDALVLYCNEKRILDKSIFLRFNYTTQYEINLTTDILRPYLITNSRFLTNLGDKLLFSTPFIFDHIIKFYPYGFSWRNLEMIPEVVLVNKEPYLRDHIKNILNYLTNYHIKQAVSGLYDFRFHSIVRKELAILSKRSDLASAAFNFTLDESLLVKRHYKKKLIELRDKHKDFTPLEGDNQFIHSLSFVQTILGDLYFYDKEYDEAILYYTESIQALRLPNGIDNRYLTRHQFLIWLRNKLKIGLTLEKMEAYDSAISLYRTLMIDSERYLHRIVNSSIDTYDETLEYQKTTNERRIVNRTQLESKGIDSRSENHRNMHLITQPFVALLASIEKNRVDGITYANLYQNKEELRRVIEPNYNHTFLEDWTGESKIELYLLKDDYRKGWLWADYFSNVGSILFYKNCQFTRFFTPNVYSDDNIESSPFENSEIASGTRILKHSEFEEDYEEIDTEKKLRSNLFDHRFFLRTDFPKLFKILNSQYNKKSTIHERKADFFPSLTSICYFWEALHELTKYQSGRILNSLPVQDKNKYSPLVIAAMFLHPKYYDMISARRFYYFGNIMSKLGDAVLASIDQLESLNIECLEYAHNLREVFLKPNEAPNTYLENILPHLDTDKLFNIKSVLAIYALSSQLFKKSNQDYSYTFSLKKTLTLYKEIVSHSKVDIVPYDPAQMEDSKKNMNYVQGLCMEIVKSTAWYNSISNRPQIIKYRDLMKWRNRLLSTIKKENQILYKASSNQSDVFEAILLTESIRRKLFKGSPLQYHEVKATDTACNKYNRLFELKYHLEVQFNKLDDTLKQDLSSFEKNILYSPSQSDKEIVCEALFSLKESIRIMQMYEPGFIIGYSFLATAHMWAGHWCRLVERMRIHNLIGDSELKSFLNSNSMYFIEHNYQYEMAIKHYINVLQMHSEGLAYKTKLNDLYILEDDYNDSLSHFNIAFERYQVNTGVIRKRVDKLKIFVSDTSQMYKYENYAG